MPKFAIPEFVSIATLEELLMSLPYTTRTAGLVAFLVLIVDYYLVNFRCMEWGWGNLLLEVFCLVLALPTLTEGFSKVRGVKE